MLLLVQCSCFRCCQLNANGFKVVVDPCWLCVFCIDELVSWRHCGRARPWLVMWFYMVRLAGDTVVGLDPGYVVLHGE
jgi:hypothetical protein